MITTLHTRFKSSYIQGKQKRCTHSLNLANLNRKKIKKNSPNSSSIPFALPPVPLLSRPPFLFPPFRGIEVEGGNKGERFIQKERNKEGEKEQKKKERER
jgi:hypothetical protein